MGSEMCIRDRNMANDLKNIGPETAEPPKAENPEGLAQREQEAPPAVTSEPTASGSETPPEPEVVELGLNAPFKTDVFSITLKEAKVGSVPLKDLFGKEGVSQNPQLMFYFAVQNTHDRKLLRFREANSFGPQHFQLVDDVENTIRGVSFGASTKAIGSLTSSQDIQPGESVQHLEVFTVPPPKTQFLILTMDTKAFGGEGQVRFRIPAESIDGFAK